MLRPPHLDFYVKDCVRRSVHYISLHVRIINTGSESRLGRTPSVFGGAGHPLPSRGGRGKSCEARAVFLKNPTVALN